MPRTARVSAEILESCLSCIVHTYTWVMGVLYISYCTKQKMAASPPLAWVPCELRLSLGIMVVEKGINIQKIFLVLFLCWCLRSFSQSALLLRNKSKQIWGVPTLFSLGRHTSDRMNSLSRVLIFDSLGDNIYVCTSYVIWELHNSSTIKINVGIVWLAQKWRQKYDEESKLKLRLISGYPRASVNPRLKINQYSRIFWNSNA